MGSGSRSFIIRRNKTKIANYISLHRRIDLTFKGFIKSLDCEWDSQYIAFIFMAIDQFIVTWLLMQHLIMKSK